MSVLWSGVGWGSQPIHHWLHFTTDQAEAVHELYWHASGRKCLEWRGHSRWNQSDGVYRWALHAALLHSAQTKNAALKENPPGYQFQHDWGEIEVEVAGQRCRINFSVNILKGPRRFHVFAAPKLDAKHTYESLVRAGLKNNNGKVVFNTGFLLLADHYDFLPRAYHWNKHMKFTSDITVRSGSTVDSAENHQ